MTHRWKPEEYKRKPTFEKGHAFSLQEKQDQSKCLPRVTTPNEDRYLAVTDKRNRRSTASDLSHQLSSATSTTVSRQTVYRRLAHIGLYSRWPARCVPFTATYCHLRLT
ncbi:transposable element Tcb1 transposase [Trichonephila clavipes]|nr:transposable element Tcb1 transposase [Trichonephila clavipes]